MTERKELGKIQSADFGFGGRDNVMFGAAFTLGGESWAVQDFWGSWAPSHVKVNGHMQWTELDRSKWHDEQIRRIEALMYSAKKRHFKDLVGVPIEVTFDGNLLKSWRVLTEVL